VRRDTRVLRYRKRYEKRNVLETEETRVERAQTKPYDRRCTGSGELDNDARLIAGRPNVAEGASPNFAR